MPARRSERPTRRDLFRQTAVGATAAAAAASGWSRLAKAIEPFARNGSPKFKFSLAAYSYRNLLKGESAPWTLADFVDECAKMNLDGTELTSYYFPTPVSDAQLRELKQQCFLLGLDVTGTAVGNDFGHPRGERRQTEIDAVKRWIDHAEILGAPVIRIFAGHQQPGTSAQESHALMVSGIEECCDYAGQHGIFLALENHGGPTATAEGLLKFVRDVKSPWFGVNLDTGNFHGADPYEQLERVAPYAINVQVKVVVSGADGKNKEPADFGRLARMLRDVDYRGYIVLEYEEAEDPRVASPRYIEKLRTAFAG